MKKLNKNEIIVIDDKTFDFFKLYEKIEIYRIYINENQMNKIDLYAENTFHFIALLWASLLEKIDINIVSEKFEYDIKNKTSININKIRDFSYFKVDKDESSYISFNNEKISYCKLIEKNEFYLEKKIFKKSDIFYIRDEIKDINDLYFSYILPFITDSKVVFNKNVNTTFKKYKPTVFIGDRKEIKILHNTILNLLSNKKILDIFYHLFRSWDNERPMIFINKYIIFNPYRSLRIVVSDEIKDIKGLWIVFESLGITIYFKKFVKKHIDIE